MLSEGQPIIIPVGVQRNENNATTFQPYDPLEVLGNTSPTSPKPQKNKCGAFGAVVMAAVAFAVVAVLGGPLTTFFTHTFASIAASLGVPLVTASATGIGLSAAAEFAVAAGTIAGAGAAAAAGSIASQGVGVATGIQDQFSWNAVALAAIGGGVGAGLGLSGIGGGGWVGGAVRGALGSAVTQGIGVATGLQDKFSWAGVAAAGASGAVIGHFGLRSIFNDPSPANIVDNVAVSTAATIANAAARSLIEGSDFGDNIMAALPDLIGQTIGEAIAGGIGRSAELRRQAQVRPDVVASLSDDAAQLLADNPGLFGSSGAGTGGSGAMSQAQLERLVRAYLARRNANNQAEGDSDARLVPINDMNAWRERESAAGETSNVWDEWPGQSLLEGLELPPQNLSQSEAGPSDRIWENYGPWFPEGIYEHVQSDGSLPLTGSFVNREAGIFDFVFAAEPDARLLAIGRERTRPGSVFTPQNKGGGYQSGNTYIGNQMPGTYRPTGSTAYVPQLPGYSASVMIWVQPPGQTERQYLTIISGSAGTGLAYAPQTIRAELPHGTIWYEIFNPHVQYGDMWVTIRRHE